MTQRRCLAAWPAAWPAADPTARLVDGRTCTLLAQLRTASSSRHRNGTSPPPLVPHARHRCHHRQTAEQPHQHRAGLLHRPCICVPTPPWPVGTCCIAPPILPRRRPSTGRRLASSCSEPWRPRALEQPRSQRLPPGRWRPPLVLEQGQRAARGPALAPASARPGPGPGPGPGLGRLGRVVRARARGTGRVGRVVVRPCAGGRGL